MGNKGSKPENTKNKPMKPNNINMQNNIDFDPK